MHLVPTVDGADYCITAARAIGGCMILWKTASASRARRLPRTSIRALWPSAPSSGSWRISPAQTLHETIVNFHNTPDRYEKFKAVLTQDKLGRAKDAAYEIEEFLKREQDGSVLMDMLRKGGAASESHPQRHQAQ